MREPMKERGPGFVAMGIAAGVAVLGAATMIARRLHVAPGRAVVGARYDEESARGRALAPPSAKARQAGHETRDMRGATMGKLVLLLGSVVTCMVFAMIGLRVWVTHTQRAAEPSFTRLQTVVVTPPEPHLQRDPLREIANLHAREDQLLGDTAYLEGSHARARIPIDRAMALTIGQPLAPPP